MISIIAIGKKHESWIVEGLERYEKRLKQPFNARWVLLPHSSYDGLRARQEESQAILSRLASDDYVLLLDETGKNLNSPEIAQLFESFFVASKNVVVIIGGAYGVSDELLQRADTIWSLSRLVFPHQLVRLLLVEQLYRAQSISTGGKYHHE